MVSIPESPPHPVAPLVARTHEAGSGRRFRRGADVVHRALLLLVAVVLVGLPGPAAGLTILDIAGTDEVVVGFPLDPDPAEDSGAAPSGARWRWRWWGADGAGPTAWRVRAASGDLRLRRPSPAALLEVHLERESEDGVRRQVGWHRGGVAVPGPLADADRSGAPARAMAEVGPDSVGVRGRLVFPDRVHDRSGYTGQVQWLPVRGLTVEWRTVQGALVARGATDADGHFEVLVDDPLLEGRLVLVTRVEDPVAGPIEVVDTSGAPHEIDLGVLDPGPGEVVDLGRLALDPGPGSQPVGAVHLLDLATDATALMTEVSPAGRGPAVSGVPTVRWDPAIPNALTFFDGLLVVVGSPAAGADDAYSDGAFLTAFAHGLLADLGLPVPEDWDWLDLEREADRSFTRAMGWAFAAAVQERRAADLRDEDGEPLRSPSTTLVDLPGAPPVGFPLAAEAALVLEEGRVDPGDRAAVVRGQRGAVVLAALLWDLVDATASADSLPGDDDLIEGDLASLVAALDTALSSAPAVVYEDVHDAWSAQSTPQDANALTVRAVLGAGCALEIDVHEPDDDPAQASVLSPWVQPPPVAEGVVINAVYLGDRDGVELSLRGSLPVDVGGWSVVARRNGFGSGPQLTVTLPSPTWILPGRQLLVLEGTPEAVRSTVDAPAPLWVVPWAPDEDGACFLLDAAGTPVDFLRWSGSGGADPSATPVPSGLTFTGELVAPVDPRLALGRDEFSTDTDAASDFVERTPTPGWPNVASARVHTLRPRGDRDHVLLPAASGPVELHARRDRDDGVPGWWVGAGAVEDVENGVGVRRTGAVARSWLDGEARTWDLSTIAPATTSTGLRVFAWRPSSDYGVWPVSGLRARPLGEGLAIDRVRLEWSPQGTTDSFRVRLDGVPVTSVAGADSTAIVEVPQGRHVLAVEPFLPDRTGPRREVAVLIGPVACGIRTGFEPDEPDLVSGSSEFLVSAGPAFEGEFALRDTPVGGSYPPNQEIVAQIGGAIDLTSTARLDFVHAAHLVSDGDRARLELSRDGGLVWEVVAEWDGSAHPVDGADPADWGDGVFEPGDWVAESIDLSDWAGERVQLRLRRTSNADGGSIGWWIDAFDLDLGGAPGELYVDAAGSDLTGCGLAERPWATLTPALAVVRPGDTLFLGPGRYEGATASAPVPVLAPLPAGVDLVGAGPDRTRLVAPDGGWGLWVRGTSPDAVFTARDLGVEGGSAAIRMEDVRAVLDSVDVVEADTALVLRRAPTLLRSTVVARSQLGVAQAGGTLRLTQATVADLGEGFSFASPGDSMVVRASLIGRVGGVLLRAADPSTHVGIECSGVFDVADWAQTSLQLVTLGLRSDDPLHCDPAAGDYGLASTSPYLSHPWCGRLGARGLGCEAPQPTAAPSPVGRARLEPPVPNPFNPRVRLAWRQPREGAARLEVFDLRGRRVRVLFDGEAAAGRHEVIWAGEDGRGRRVGSGVYLVRLVSGGEADVRRVALVR